jgi:hypothetical protein
MLSAQVPLVMASKTLRHSTVSTTTEIYAHLLRPIANNAVNTMETARYRGNKLTPTATTCDHDPQKPTSGFAFDSNLPFTSRRADRI